MVAQTIRIFPCAALIVAMIISEVEVAWPETPSEWFDWVREWFQNIS
jgi:hypothetical protein